MSEANKPREMATIQQEYVNLCTKAGDLQYKIDCFKKDLNLINESLRELNMEAVAASKAAEEAKAAAIAAEPAPTLAAVPTNG